LAARHIYSQPLHCLFKFDAVFPSFDGIHLHSNHLNAVFFEDAAGRQFRAKIQPALSPQIGQKGIGTLLLDDFGHIIKIKRFYICYVCHLRVCHNRSRVGVDQHDFKTEFSKRFARLRAGIIKFTGLADDDRT